MKATVVDKSRGNLFVLQVWLNSAGSGVIGEPFASLADGHESLM